MSGVAQLSMAVLIIKQELSFDIPKNPSINFEIYFNYLDLKFLVDKMVDGLLQWKYR